MSLAAKLFLIIILMGILKCSRNLQVQINGTISADSIFANTYCHVIGYVYVFPETSSI